MMTNEPMRSLATDIARSYPVPSEFVYQVLVDFDGDEAKARQWLDAQAPTGHSRVHKGIEAMKIALTEDGDSRRVSWFLDAPDIEGPASASK